MNKALIFLSIVLISSCASIPEYEKKNYVKIGNTDPYSLKQTIDLNNVYRKVEFDPEQDKVKLLRVGVGGVDTFVTRQPFPEEIELEKVSEDDEDFNGLAADFHFQVLFIDASHLGPNDNLFRCFKHIHLGCPAPFGKRKDRTDGSEHAFDGSFEIGIKWVEIVTKTNFNVIHYRLLMGFDGV